jgi:hypothetical protein
MFPFFTNQSGKRVFVPVFSTNWTLYNSPPPCIMDAPDSTSSRNVDSTLSPEPDRTTQTDNFYSPENLGFYAHQPYESLDRASRTIRLLAVKQDDLANGNVASWMVYRFQI